MDRDNGKKRSFHTQRVSADTLAPIMREHISPDANIMTDEASAYTLVGREFASHEVVNHGGREYVRGSAHTNTIETSFSLLKRGLVGSFHHGGEQHLQRYCTEFDFRWNCRSANGFEDTDRADAILNRIQGKRPTYRQPNETRA